MQLTGIFDLVTIKGCIWASAQSLIIQASSKFNQNELNLFESYLTNHKQFVDIDGTKSEMLQISTGVPQGSVLGPLLFIICMNDISFASNIFKLVIYADDSTLYSILSAFHINCNNINNVSETIMN